MKHYIKILTLIISALVIAFVFSSCNNNEFNVIFMVDGEPYYTTGVSKSKTVTMPQDPKKDDHTFEGWFLDSGKWTIPFDKDYFTDKDFSTDIYVYAKWYYQHVHNPGEWIIDTDPTCSEEGVKIKKCTRCDEILATEAIQTTSHTKVDVSGFAETETKDGLTDGSYCSVCNSIITPQEIIPAHIQGTELKADLFEKDGNILTAVFPNSKSQLSIKECIKTNYKATVSVFYDREATIPADDLIQLNEGENRFYIRVANEGETEFYDFIVRRLLNYTLTFYSSETEVFTTITAEESSLATAPETAPSKQGYRFDGWDFDFTLPVTEDVSVKAKWTANENTPYSVEYYVNQDEGFTLYDEKRFAATTDSVVNAEIIEIENHFYNADLSVAMGVVLPDGSLVLKLYYQKTTFKVSFNTGCDVKIDEATVEINSTLDAPSEIENGNRVFLGWYHEDTLWNFNSDTVTEDTILNAKWGYVVTFVIDGDETYVYVAEGEKLEEPETPKSETKTFSGWYIIDTDEKWNFETLIFGPITLVAKWGISIPTTPMAPA